MIVLSDRYSVQLMASVQIKKRGLQASVERNVQLLPAKPNQRLFCCYSKEQGLIQSWSG